VVWRTSSDRIDRLVVFHLGSAKPKAVGELVFEGTGRVRRSFFRYAGTWLKDPDGHAIVPVGLPKRPRAVRSDPYEVPTAFFDAGPDGWGKGILSAAFPNSFFGMGEFLAASGDDRTGDLGFGPSPEDGPLRWEPETPLLDLPDGVETLQALVEAADAVEEGRAERHHFRLLFHSSADIGGARPKARIHRDGVGLIAKFPAWGDAFDEPKVEAVCLALARACLIDVPDHEVISVANRSVLLVKRFDRTADGNRLGYMSAATLLNHPPNEYFTRYSYADLAIRSNEVGIEPCSAEIYRRLLFNVLIHNTDDHLRNHAFLRDGKGWKLSPAFDLVPHRQERLVLRPARDIDPIPDPAVASAAYSQIGLRRADAETIYEQVVEGMASLPYLLDRYGVSQRDREILVGYWPYALRPPPFAG
jgi:serine/threonine-protein kinase HipA